MNLSLVSHKPSSMAVNGLLQALQTSADVGTYFNRIVVTSPSQWNPTRDEAAILLLDDEVHWPESAAGETETSIGLPVLPLWVCTAEDSGGANTRRGPDVRDPRYYFVSNGIVMDGHEWESPTSSQLLLDKLASYLPLLSRLSLLRQRSQPGTVN
ncbi:hypothetical protein [Aeromonas sp. BIGb0445]|uniref:hypothetical protein n=1 Tax=Aeromonas sp. BIGb0445 TaxID=2940593 RepID=UPI002167E117|nr:hypothetical protein [Aeromonas sp. BIGb0445]MCS3458655.1 hypothetical protein [Aeromonas sp. BIGb0445]